MMTDKRRRLAALAATAVVLTLAVVGCVPVPVQVITPTAPTATPTVQSPTPDQTPDQEPPLVEVLAPIEKVEILGAESLPLEISLSVVSGLPNSCAQFDRREVVRDGDIIEVTIVNVEPVGVACADVYGTVTHHILLDGDFEAGRTYGLVVNDVIETFVAGSEAQPPASAVAALNRPFRLKLGQAALLEPQLRAGPGGLSPLPQRLGRRGFRRGGNPHRPHDDLHGHQPDQWSVLFLSSHRA